MNSIEHYNKHYIATDTQGRITSGWSDGPHPKRDTANVICINQQGGYQFRLFPGGEENPPLYTMDGIPLYRWDGERVMARTDEEIEADRAEIPAPPPSPQEQLRADLAATQKKLAASIQSNAMLEECLVEMAGVVYG